MRSLGLLFAWLAASLTAYLLAAVASQQVVLGMVDAYKAVPLGVNLRSTLAALTAQPIATQYLAVIAIGFLIAFYVASVVKALIPRASGIAYPTAGASAIVVALVLMRARYDIVPILGAQTTYGFWLQILAGAVGGIVFEIVRPREPVLRERRRGI